MIYYCEWCEQQKDDDYDICNEVQRTIHDHGKDHKVISLCCDECIEENPEIKEGKNGLLLVS